MINYLKNKLGVVDFANAQGLVNIVKDYYSKETVEQWPMYTLYKVTVKLMYTLYNNLTNFSKKIVKSA